MFGISSIAALAMSTKVERAVMTSGRPAVVVAGHAHIDALPRAIRASQDELATARRHLAELEELARHTRARIEEWTA